MIQRYLGNKNSIAESIIHEIQRFCNPGDVVCDIFSGTVSMSMALKTHGFRVVSNDINLFSYHFANSYLKNNKIPVVDLKKLGINAKELNDEIDAQIASKRGSVGFTFLNERNNEEKYRDIVAVLVFLQKISVNDIGKDFRDQYFFNTYTCEGKNSNFVSLRGTKGTRRFFTPDNGRKLDLILNKIREWYQNNKLSKILYSILISVVCESVEKISNTQGTFHDFQRIKYDSRALNPLSLRLPPFDNVLGTNNKHMIGRCQDSLRFIRDVPQHSVIYIDPPYNFRQYTSYYFMLNLISRYCEIKSLKSYFAKVQHVRGQNMTDDFDSTFCKSNLFISSLKELIQNARAKYVVMSYYDGRNHENKSYPRDDFGIAQIEELFKGDLFVPGSYELKSFERTNYQSFRGHSACKCKEFLFIAEKR